MGGYAENNAGGGGNQYKELGPEGPITGMDSLWQGPGMGLFGFCFSIKILLVTAGNAVGYISTFFLIILRKYFL